MMKFVKSGKVVFVLGGGGRFAGSKAGIVKNNHGGTQDNSCSHALVAGIDRYSRKVTRSIGKKKLKRGQRPSSLTFTPTQVYNCNHLVPTIFSVDVSFKKNVVNKTSLDEILHSRGKQEGKSKPSLRKGTRLAKTRCFSRG